jgi:hypothetical protein
MLRSTAENQSEKESESELLNPRATRETINSTASNIFDPDGVVFQSQHQWQQIYDPDGVSHNQRAQRVVLLSTAENQSEKESESDLSKPRVARAWINSTTTDLFDPDGVVFQSQHQLPQIYDPDGVSLHQQAQRVMLFFERREHYN